MCRKNWWEPTGACAELRGIPASASLPICEAAGLRAAANLYAGHNQVIAGTTASPSRRRLDGS